jgi:flagellar biosynthesis chaperone FliJ
VAKEYPLEQLAIIKQKKLEEAEKLLREKKEILEKESKKLKSLEEERDKVKEHKDAKLTQLREALDQETTTDKIQQMRQYLKVVVDELKKKDIKVKEQEKQVQTAKNEVDLARTNLVKKQQDVEKLVEHRKDWQKEKYAEEEHKESIESDEIGSAKYILKRHEAKKRKKQE